MTNELPILALTGLLTVFFLLSVLLFILYSRNLVQLRAELEANVTNNKSYNDLYRVYKDTFQKCKELSVEYGKSEANGKALNALLEQAGEQRKQLRKDFVEQSELATEWRQKYDRLERLNSDIERINANLTDANNQMSAELDRGNEMIAWMKSDLEKAHELNTRNEKIILQLLVNGKFLDKNGNYKGTPLFQDDESFDVGRYIDSLYRSKVVKHDFDSKRNSVASTAKGIDHQLRSTDGEEEFEKHTPVKTLPLESAIDWNVPQPFPKNYYIPMDTNVISIENPERVGKTTEKSTVPFLTWSNGVNSIRSGYKLAPLNPTDHPFHPEFGKLKLMQNGLNLKNPDLLP